MSSSKVYYIVNFMTYDINLIGGITVAELHPSHVTRFSDASTFDEICVNCGAHDDVPGGWGELAKPCTNPQKKEPSKEPDKETTQTSTSS
jgi:hypothetical protein